MNQTKDIMGMPITVEIRDDAAEKGFDLVFDYFNYIDQTFSTYKPNSEISKINRGELLEKQFSKDVKEIFKLAEQTKTQTRGFFNILHPDGHIDPSGIVKGWAIWQASLILEKHNYQYFFIDAGGDIQGHVKDSNSQPWQVGIRNPFKPEEVIKILKITNQGVATSGTYERGQHIYVPHQPNKVINDVASITVIGHNIYEADRFATAAFAMGKDGINFIESLDGLEAYMVDSGGIATLTSGFKQFIKN